MLINAKTDFYLNFIKDDPIRPNISAVARVTNPHEVYVLESDQGEIEAVICVAFTKDVPTTEEELFSLQEENRDIAVFYTVWSYSPGAGRKIVFEVAKEIKSVYNSKRYITLSPKTEMARKFHLKNGAFKLQENELTVNYEYSKDLI